MSSRAESGEAIRGAEPPYFKEQAPACAGEEFFSFARLLPAQAGSCTSKHGGSALCVSCSHRPHDDVPLGEIRFDFADGVGAVVDDAGDQRGLSAAFDDGFVDML